MIELSFGGYIESMKHYCLVKISGEDIESVLKESLKIRDYLRKTKQLNATSEARSKLETKVSPVSSVFVEKY